MNTAAAAQIAGVTTRTIRRWAAAGVIAATKRGRSWNINERSLMDHVNTRSSQGATPPAQRDVVADDIRRLGGQDWQRGGHHRIYLNDWESIVGFEINRYKSGNISSASLQGEGIANGRASKMLGAIRGVYWDVNRSKLVVSHYRADRIDIRWLDGTRSSDNLLDLIFQEVRAAALAA